MPTPPSTVQGAVVQALQADAALAALVPAGNVVAGEESPERNLPFVVVHDEAAKPRWVTTTNRLELHRLRVNVYAKAATAAGQANPSEAIALNVERVVNWLDLAVINTTPVRFEQTGHALALDPRRAGDKERVFRCQLTWEVELYRTG
jgi:hypothetical protein